MKSNEYDRTEAEALLVRLASVLIEDRRGKMAAANELVDAFLKLDNFAGVRVILDSGDVRSQLRIDVVAGGKTTHVTYSAEDNIFRVGGGTPMLRYNPVNRSFEGDAKDHFYEPKPGQPQPRRAALAVLVESVCKALNVASVL